MAFNSSATSPENLYKYNGKEEQPETGWLDYGFRMYDPTLGRWFNIDPLAEDFYSYSPYNYVENNPLNMIDPDGRSGEAVIEGDKIIVKSHIYFYGAGANDQTRDQSLEVINDQWNGANASVEIDGKTYQVEFQVTGEVVSMDKAEELANGNGDDVVNNFIRVEDVGGSSFMAGKNGSPYADSNSGLFTVNDIQNESTTAHEYGHGLGWFEFGEADNGAHDTQFDDGVPGIMAPRGTKVSDAYGLPYGRSGQKTIDPSKRKVKASDVTNVLSGSLNDLSKNGRANLGRANNLIIK